VSTRDPARKGAWQRRDFLAALLGGVPALCGVSSARALGPKSKVRLGQLRYAGGNPDPRPTALRRLAWEIDKRTSIDVALEPAPLRVTDKGLFDHPLLYMGGDRAFDPWPEPEINRLHRFLVYGGFLVIDSADPRPGAGFDRSVRRLASQLFPTLALKKVDPAHTVHKSFYLLQQVVGRVAAAPHLEAVERDGRLLLVYSQNDLAGAWDRDNFGQWLHGVHPGGERQRELAFRWGINLVM
jgi:hypothetical protein